MKKAKLMLVGIATFAILGAGLAVSANKHQSIHTFYSTNPAGHCNVTFTTAYTTSLVGITKPWSVASTTATCPTLTVTTAN